MVRKAVFDKPLLKPDKLCGNPVRGIKCPYIIAGFDIGCLIHHTTGGVGFKIKPTGETKEPGVYSIRLQTPAQKFNKCFIFMKRQGFFQVVGLGQYHCQRLKNFIENIAFIPVKAEHDNQGNGHTVPVGGGIAQI